MLSLRTIPIILAMSLGLAACDNSDKQAGALDNAANQSDPAAAEQLRNEADTIREQGTEANLSDPDSPAQNALENAGNAAADTPSTPQR